MKEKERIKKWQMRPLVKEEDIPYSSILPMEYVNPIDLERYYQEDDLTTIGSPMDKLLLCVSEVLRGEGSLDELYFCTMDYRKFIEKVNDG